MFLGSFIDRWRSFIDTYDYEYIPKYVSTYVGTN